jgi:hypothetical protein
MIYLGLHSNMQCRINMAALPFGWLASIGLAALAILDDKNYPDAHLYA